MKKLSVILSVLLCLSAMVTGVSAESTGEVLTGGDALAIYEKCVNKMGKAEYLEIRCFITTTFTDSEPVKTTRRVVDYKFAGTQENGFQMEMQMWDSNGERTSYFVVDSEYIYDCTEKQKYRITEDITMGETVGETVYSLTGTEEDDYKDAIKNLKAEKIDGGYRLWYSVHYFGKYKYTLVIDDDFRLESVTKVFIYGENGVKDSYRYEILSINRPFKIKFPPDLSSYKLF